LRQTFAAPERGCFSKQCNGRGLACWSRGLPVSESSRARAFRRYHARPLRRIGRTHGAEKLAFEGGENTSQDVATGATAWLSRGFHLYLETIRVEVSKCRAEAKSRCWQGPKAPPCRIHGLEYAIEKRQGHPIALWFYRSTIRILHLGLSIHHLLEQHRDALKHVQGFESGNHAWHPMIVCQRLIHARAQDGAHMTGTEQTIELQSFILNDDVQGGSYPLGCRCNEKVFNSAMLR